MSDLEDMIDRFSRSLDPIDREPFRRTAQAALSAIPPAMVGPGTIFRATEAAWRTFFRPPDHGEAGWGGPVLKPRGASETALLDTPMAPRERDQ